MHSIFGRPSRSHSNSPKCIKKMYPTLLCSNKSYGTRGLDHSHVQLKCQDCQKKTASQSELFSVGLMLCPEMNCLSQLIVVSQQTSGVGRPPNNR